MRSIGVAMLAKDATATAARIEAVACDFMALLQKIGASCESQGGATGGGWENQPSRQARQTSFLAAGRSADRPASARARRRRLTVDSAADRRARPAGALGRRSRVGGYAASGRSAVSRLRRFARAAGILNAGMASWLIAFRFFTVGH